MQGLQRKALSEHRGSPVCFAQGLSSLPSHCPLQAQPQQSQSRCSAMHGSSHVVRDDVSTRMVLGVQQLLAISDGFFEVSSQ